MKTGFLWIAVLFAAVALLGGCQQKRIVSTSGDPDPRDCISRSSALDYSCIGSMQIVMFSDTLRILPNDTTWVNGFVVVKDDAGRVMPFIWVCLDLDQDFGWIEFTDSLRNTSDTRGRVSFRFGTLGVIGPGYQTIHAWVGTKEDRWTMWLQPALPPFRLNISVSKDVLQVNPPDEDSVEVTVTIKDTLEVGVPNASLLLHASGGRLGSLPPTNAMGVATTWWWTNNEPAGRYCISVNGGGQVDTAWVTIRLVGIRVQGAIP